MKKKNHHQHVGICKAKKEKKINFDYSLAANMNFDKEASHCYAGISNQMSKYKMSSQTRIPAVANLTLRFQGTSQQRQRQQPFGRQGVLILSPRIMTTDDRAFCLSVPTLVANNGARGSQSSSQQMQPSCAVACAAVDRRSTHSNSETTTSL